MVELGVRCVGCGMARSHCSLKPPRQFIQALTSRTQQQDTAHTRHWRQPGSNFTRTQGIMEPSATAVSAESATQGANSNSISAARAERLARPTPPHASTYAHIPTAAGSCEPPLSFDDFMAGAEEEEGKGQGSLDGAIMQPATVQSGGLSGPQPTTTGAHGTGGGGGSTGVQLAGSAPSTTQGSGGSTASTQPGVTGATAASGTAGASRASGNASQPASESALPRGK